MASLDIILISYKGKDYPAAVIPDVFSNESQRLLIGSHSLDIALYDVDKGYVDNEAREIDEQIYAFVDDEFFSLSSEKFIDNVRILLD